MGDAPVIGVYDVFACRQEGRRLLVAGEASGYEVVGDHRRTLAPAADPLLIGTTARWRYDRKSIRAMRDAFDVVVQLALQVNYL